MLKFLRLNAFNISVLFLMLGIFQTLFFTAFIKQLFKNSSFEFQLFANLGFLIMLATLLFFLIKKLERKIVHYLHKREGFQAKTENLLEHAPFAILLFHPNGQLYFCNAHCKKYFKMNDEQFEQFIKHFNLFEDTQLQKQGVDAVLKKVLQGEMQHLFTFKYTLTHFKHEPNFIWCDAYAYPLFDDNNNLIHLVLTLQDVSATKTAELEICRLNQELEQAISKCELNLQQSKQDLQENERVLKRSEYELLHSQKTAIFSKLVAGITHQINTPMKLGMVATEHLHEELNELSIRYENGALEKEEFDAFINLAQNLLDVISNNYHLSEKHLESFQKISQDQFNETSRGFNLKSYLEHILNNLQMQIEQTPTKVEIQLNISKYLNIDSFPSAFAQIFTSLIINSLEHGFHQKQTKGLIRISASKENNELILTYEDNGQGIAESIEKRLFKPFISTHKHKHGLGLHLVHEIINKQLHGSIVYDESLKQGCRFEIRLKHEEALLNT